MGTGLNLRHYRRDSVSAIDAVDLSPGMLNQVCNRALFVRMRACSVKIICEQRLPVLRALMDGLVELFNDKGVGGGFVQRQGDLWRSCSTLFNGKEGGGGARELQFFLRIRERVDKFTDHPLLYNVAVTGPAEGLGAEFWRHLLHPGAIGLPSLPPSLCRLILFLCVQGVYHGLQAEVGCRAISRLSVHEPGGRGIPPRYMYLHDCFGMLITRLWAPPTSKFILYVFVFAYRR